MGGGGTIADKNEDKDVEKDVDDNKDLMKDNSVLSLSYPYLTTTKLTPSVNLPMLKLIKLINHVRSSSSSSSLYFSLSGGAVVGHEPYEAQPGREGVGGVQGGSPVSPW